MRCSSRTGHVVQLNLRNNVSPDDDYAIYLQTALEGQISPSLLSLQHLELLDLSCNSLEGPTGYMPEFLGSLTNLRYLNLSGNNFLDLVPPHLGNLSKLRYLDISSSWGDSYSTDILWITNLPRLRYLNMALVNLSMVVDWPHVVNMVSSLRVLDLSNCMLASANQSLTHLNLTKLEELHLQYNFFHNPIESCWFWNITSLKYLNLARTELYGQTPNALGDLASLEVLDLSYILDTSYRSDYGWGIMTGNMKNLCNLRILDLTFSLLHGNITEILESLPQCSSNRLKGLYLGGNNITGTLPNWIWRFAGIITLDLSDNYLTGVLPSEISMLTNLTEIDLSNNYFDGFVTEGHFANLTRLNVIDLSWSSLNIVVDPELLPPFRLKYADFSHCHMGPLFPAWLQSQVDIAELHVSGTGIDDVLPDWFCATFSKATLLDISQLPKNLTSLDISRNSFSGKSSFPKSCNNLASLDISRNSFSGKFPSFLWVGVQRRPDGIQGARRGCRLLGREAEIGERQPAAGGLRRGEAASRLGNDEAGGKTAAGGQASSAAA